MSSEDVLPTYDEAMKMYQTPWRIIEDEAMNLTFKQPSSTSSKIKSFITRSESASQHGVYTGPKRKSKIVVFVENILTARTPKRFHVAELREAQENMNDQGAHSRQHQKMTSDGEELFDT